jgi:hypothetical protein
MSNDVWRVQKSDEDQNAKSNFGLNFIFSAVLVLSGRSFETGPQLNNRRKTMAIEGTEFGSITIDGELYEHDVVIRLSGKVEKRQKKLSKERYGTSHVISKAEAKSVYEDGCDQLIVGAGQQGMVHLSSEASAYFEKKGCKVILKPTPEAIRSFNESRKKKIGLMHVTC